MRLSMKRVLILFLVSVLLCCLCACGDDTESKECTQTSTETRETTDFCTDAPVKPIVYLYPECETELTVTLGHPERLSCVYPAYDEGWNVSVKPDGTMTDLATGRNLYALYWEGIPGDFAQTDEGFCVAGKDTAAFLEEKLALLGLSEREAEEMIIYWLPLMKGNPFNYIRFASAEEIDAYMPLGFSVQPDSIIRVLMLTKPLDAPVKVSEQIIETPVREGFVAVEWGGVRLG